MDLCVGMKETGTFLPVKVREPLIISSSDVHACISQGDSELMFCWPEERTNVVLGDL